jgi:ABC-2 type transport system permease protein
MWRQIISVSQTEVYKLFRKGKSYIGFGAVAFIIVVINIALAVDGESYLNLGTQTLKDSFLFQGNLLNGYLSVYIILSSLWVHIPFLIALVTGDLLAGEGSTGTYRLLLTRPLSRHSIVAGKFIAATVYVLAMIISMAVLSIGMGLMVFGKGDLFVMKDIIYIFNEDDSMWRIMFAFGFSFFSMATVAAITFMFSAFTENPITPIIITMSMIIAFMIVSAIDLSVFRAAKPFMFTTYMGSWREFFSDPVDWHKVRHALMVLVLHIVVCLGITHYYFKRKDITA